MTDGSAEYVVRARGRAGYDAHLRHLSAGGARRGRPRRRPHGPPLFAAAVGERPAGDCRDGRVSDRRASLEASTAPPRGLPSSAAAAVARLPRLDVPLHPPRVPLGRACAAEGGRPTATSRVGEAPPRETGGAAAFVGGGSAVWG